MVDIYDFTLEYQSACYVLRMYYVYVRIIDI